MLRDANRSLKMSNTELLAVIGIFAIATGIAIFWHWHVKLYVVAAIAAAVATVRSQVDEHRELLQAGNQQSLGLASNLDALALQSRGNVEQLGSMHHALHEHSQANQSLSEQLQQISDALLRQSGDNQQLHELTLYLTQMTAILEARP